MFVQKKTTFFLFFHFFLFFSVFPACVTSKLGDADINNKEFLEEISRVLSKNFNSEVHIKSVVQLTEEERRNRVLRVTLKGNSKKTPRTVILKQSFPEDSEQLSKAPLSRFARDWAGLEFLTSIEAKNPLAPKFYGGSKKHNFILQEDLGKKHITIIDALKEKDKKAAYASLKRFMGLLGEFHAEGSKKVADYQTFLHKVDPQKDTRYNETKALLDDLKLTLNKLGMSYTEEIKREAKAALKSMFEPEHFATVVHGDICPDNVFDNPEENKMALIDFEHSGVRSMFWDASYLRMNMPTCWYFASLPNKTIDDLDLVYRQKLSDSFPASLDDDLYGTAYTSAAAFWLLNIFRNVHNHLEDKGDLSNKGYSRVLSRIEAFITISQKYNKLLHLRKMAEIILERLKNKWPGVKPLEMFPAFMPSE
jgi:thiamine kinase-like enzyme